MSVQAPETGTSDVTTARSAGLRAWHVVLAVVALTVALVAGPPLADRADRDVQADWLRYSADHVREQMAGSPTDQIVRTVLPPRATHVTYRSWVKHDETRWAMCLHNGATGDVQHLIFSGTGAYGVADGPCPSTPTFDVAAEGTS